jgi:hypothetical protein
VGRRRSCEGLFVVLHWEWGSGVFWADLCFLGLYRPCYSARQKTGLWNALAK